MKRLISLVLVLIIGIAGGGCEESIAPFLETNRYFTIYGYLDTGADVQYVRVEPLRRLIDPPPPGPIDAEVSITELETGQVITWTDSLVTFDNDIYGHVYYANFTPVHNYTYRLDVRRSDGATTSATTTVPPNVEALINDPFSQTAGGFSRYGQRILWPTVDFKPFSVQVWYRFGRNRPNQPFRDIFLPYTDEDIGALQDGLWNIVLDLSEDRRMLFESAGIDPEQSGAEFPLTLYSIGVQVASTDGQWRPPNGIFDAEILIQPGVLSNVEDGFGFFGSVAQLKTEWTFTPDWYQRLGYPYPQ